VATTSAWLSREQRAEGDFVEAMTQLRARFEQPEGRTAVDATTEALLRFGSCERRMRRAERLRALGLRESEADELTASALADNERGLAALAGVRPFLTYLSKQEPDPEALPLWREASPQIRAEWRAHVAELDLGRDDARHLYRIMDECCDATDEASLDGLGRHLARTLDELEQARRADDRGTHAASFPYWKIVVAAAILGIAISSAVFLITNGAPWWQPYLIWLLACLALLFTVLAC
jgi:hypothetical protein